MTVCLSALPPLAAAEGDDSGENKAEPPSSSLARRPDERRSVTSEFRLFGQTMRLSGEYELSIESRQNLDLRRSRSRDRDRIDQELKLEAMFSPAVGSTVFLQLVGVSEIETRRENGPVESRGALERGQTWLHLERLAGLPLALQLGRISLVEERSWWWDEDLDAARIIVEEGDWRLETGLAQRLMPVSTDERGIDPEAEKIARWFGRASWHWRKRHQIDAFWLVARDHSGRAAAGSVLAETREDKIDAHFNWLGLRVAGEERTKSKHRLGYWLDVAHLWGSETDTDFDSAGRDSVVVDRHDRRSVEAYGWDIGASWSLPGKTQPTLWVSWAVGSGDGNGSDDTDRRFRQTGLEENKGRIGGVKRFRFYGELMRPTLSNLSIRSLGVSARFLDKSSADLVFHDYRQRQASDHIADSRIDLDPTGESRALGQEIDLFLAFRESPRTELIISLATFRAGSAFGRRGGERAWRAEVGVTINF